MNSKIDFLKDCISDVSGKLGRMVPIDDFNRAFCIVCVNNECARSKSSNLKFEHRVNNWQKNYFDEVPRADGQDPKFESIRIKRFISPGDQNVYVMSSETIPQSIPETSNSESIEPELETTNSEQDQMPQPLIEPKNEESSVIEPKVPEGQTNTEFIQGTMLPGSPSKDISLDPGQVFVFDDEE